MWEFLTILLGACLAQFLLRNRKLESTLIESYKRYHPETSDLAISKFVNSVLPIIGALIAYKFFSPDTFFMQLSSGFCWNATLETFMKKS